MKCWYCNEKERVDKDSLFCKECEDVKKETGPTMRLGVHNSEL